MKTDLAFILLSLLCAALLGACGRALPAATATAPPQTSTIEPAPSATATLRPTETSSPTETPAPADTPAPTQIPAPTNTPASTWTPAPTKTAWDLSNLGRIVYYSESAHAVYLVNADGSGKRLLFPDGDFKVGYFSGFSWSPDGRSFAFSTEQWADVILHSLDQAESRDITEKVGQIEYDPDWSPDGRKIAFTGYMQSKHFNIYVMNADGSEITQLTDCADPCREPDWSPSGEGIVYLNGLDVYIMNADGSGDRRLATGLVNTAPAWSPDGQQVAFLRADIYGPHWLFLVNQDGSGIRQVTDSTVNPHRPSWSPDGQYIVFDNFIVGEQWGTLWIVDVLTGALKQIGAGVCHSPEWSPLSPVDTPDCTSGWTRLKAGGLARLAGEPGSPPNRVRSGPETGDNISGMLQPGTIVKLLEGPVCVDGLVFWKVYSAGIPGGTGWTAEGDGEIYWLEPYGP